jgi:hypothetical protein
MMSKRGRSSRPNPPKDCEKISRKVLSFERGASLATLAQAEATHVPASQLLAPSSSEDVLQSRLDDASIQARGGDLSEVARAEIRQGIDGPLAVVRVGELRVVKGVEELGSELERLLSRILVVFRIKISKLN